MKIVIKIFMISLLCACSDIVSSNYATYEQAREDELFLRGWLPEILPVTATNISIRNNLDLNASTGHFEFPAEDISNFLSNLNKLSINSYRYQASEHGQIWVFTVYGPDKITYEIKQE